MLDAQRHVEEMLHERYPFDQVEAAINSLPLPDEHKAALWLLAWSEQDRHTRRRVVLEALTSVDS